MPRETLVRAPGASPTGPAPAEWRRCGTMPFGIVRPEALPRGALPHEPVLLGAVPQGATPQVIASLRGNTSRDNEAQHIYRPWRWRPKLFQREALRPNRCSPSGAPGRSPRTSAAGSDRYTGARPDRPSRFSGPTDQSGQIDPRDQTDLPDLNDPTDQSDQIDPRGQTGHPDLCGPTDLREQTGQTDRGGQIEQTDQIVCDASRTDASRSGPRKYLLPKKWGSVARRGARVAGRNRDTSGSEAPCADTTGAFVDPKTLAGTVTEVGPSGNGSQVVKRPRGRPQKQVRSGGQNPVLSRTTLQKSSRVSP